MRAKLKTFERCWIIGAGAVGSVLAAVLCLAGKRETYLVGQSPHARAVREKGLIFQVNAGESHHVKIITVSPLEVPLLKAHDLVLLTQKLPGLEATAAWLRTQCLRETGIIALQNGIGFEELLIKNLGRPVDRGLVFFGANTSIPGRVHYFPGRIRLRPSEVTEAFASIMEGSLLPCELSADFNKSKWQKLAVNCVANPLAGILGANNRQIIGPVLDMAKEAILDEVREVALAEGVSIRTTAKDINRYLDSDNTPSLRPDLERKFLTEIDFLNGAVVRLGEKNGISTPVNALLVSLVKFLES